ncbi:MAG TPA: histidine phosphatase family protein, partial [Spirochaetia bacterium]|nr:histidine phosphatase family protein [Spirochaetia bacterium]
MLYLIRHGEAKDSGEDPKRDLSAQGEHHAAQAGEFLARHGISIDTIWHSGKRRAEHTARIIAAAIGKGEIVELH